MLTIVLRIKIDYIYINEWICKIVGILIINRNHDEDEAKYSFIFGTCQALTGPL